MSSCVFLLGEAAHGSEKIGRKPFASYTGPDKTGKEKREGKEGEDKGGRRHGEEMWSCVVRMEEGKSALANLQEGRLSHKALAGFQLFVHVCV